MAKKSKSQSHAGVEIRGVDLSEVERLLAFMDRHGLEEFEYQRGNVHFRLKKASAHAATSPLAMYLNEVLLEDVSGAQTLQRWTDPTAFGLATGYPALRQAGSLVFTNSIGGVRDEDYQQLQGRLRPPQFAA